MPKKSTRRATPARRRRAQTIPLGLQMIVRCCYPSGWNVEALARQYGHADALVARLVASTLTPTLDVPVYDAAISPLLDAAGDKEDIALARAAIVHYFASDATQEPCTSPESAADEVIDGIAHSHAAEGFQLGVCMAYRLSRAAAGQDGAR